MTGGLRILVIGGYGIFGGRIVRLLEGTPELTLIVAGRSKQKAAAFCASRTDAKAQLIPAAIDRNDGFADRLAELSPDLAIDASGPFQNYGDGRYAVIEACLDRRVHYLDLADGSDFVAGVAAFDDRARNAGIFVLSGVSSFPVLTAAVVRHLSAGMVHIHSICGGIAPSPFAGVGMNVIRAIASYAGQPVRLLRDGAAGTAYPFTEARRFTIAPPGRLPLRRTLFSLVDVPDLRALALLWPDAGSIWMGAGPVPEVLHRALMAWAWLVRLRLLPTLSFLAPLMHAATNRLRWGEHRGGMFVQVAGADSAGQTHTRSWHLLAEGDDGPLIPSMAAEAIVRNILAGRAPKSGARAAVRDLELSDYETLFERRTIHTGTREESSAGAPLYARILGDAWNALPRPIRSMHDFKAEKIVSGRARVTRGRGLLSRLVAKLVGFPEEAADVPVKVHFSVQNGRETWTRTFGGVSFSSVQAAGTGARERLLCERFGVLTFAMALVLDKGRLSLVPRSWTVFGIPLPRRLLPDSNAYEHVADGRFQFHVEISHPLTGLIVRYEGWLEPA